MIKFDEYLIENASGIEYYKSLIFVDVYEDMGFVLKQAVIVT